MADQQAGSRGRNRRSTSRRRRSRAGRNLPAAIGVGVVLGAMAIGILLFAPIWWLPVLAVAIPIATHEVVRRLREAGYALPVIPLLIGGQAMIWLTWPYGPAGVLGAYGGTVVVCMVWRLVGQGLREQPVNYLRDISATVLARDVGTVVREFQCAADLPGPRRVPDVHA